MYKLSIMILILSLVLASCKKDGAPPKEEGEPQTQGESTGSDASGPEGPAQATPKTSELHWIYSVSFRRIDAGSFQMGSPDGGKKYGQSDE
ncbi:MAG: hypothetical protein OXM55_06395, partial [Bdellovibrionales bacterium]|nr:hypothetical protein [Bdellovibrionales bacterium]